MNISDLRRVQARLAGLPRDGQAAVSFAIVQALRPLAELGEEVIAPADAVRPLAGARSAMESASPDALRLLLAEAEAMPVMAASEEPPGNAGFAVDVLACLIYAIKTRIEPEAALWSARCVQRAYDCLFFADEALDRSGGPAGLVLALDAWLDGDGGDRLRRESANLAALAGAAFTPPPGRSDHLPRHRPAVSAIKAATTGHSGENCLARTAAFPRREARRCRGHHQSRRATGNRIRRWQEPLVNAVV